MSQRYFLTAESTYEDLRASLNVALGYPNSLGKSVFQTALYAPRDSFRRVLLAVDTAIQGYATINAALMPLIDSDAVEEIDEATYLAAVASASQGGGGGVSSWNDLTDKPATFPPSAHTHVAADITDFGAAVAAASPEEVVEFLTPANFPATGASSRLYVATDDGRAYRWVGSQYAEVGPTSTFLLPHTHSASEIATGVIAPARLGTGATATNFLRGDSTFADPVTYATTAQATDWNSATVAMSPARMLDAMLGWSQFVPNGSANTSGGGTTFHAMQVLSDSGSTAGGTTVTFTNSNGGITNLLSPQSRGVNWSKRRYFCVRIRRESTASSAGFGRFYYGWLTTAAAGGQPTARCVGFELRGTAPRLWVIAHNGTTLTQVDSGWDVTGGSDLHNEFLVESAAGTVNVYVDGTLRGTTSGGPTTLSNDAPQGINYQVGNGGTAARTAFFISAARFTT